MSLCSRCHLTTATRNTRGTITQIGTVDEISQGRTSRLPRSYSITALFLLYGQDASVSAMTAGDGPFSCHRFLISTTLPFEKIPKHYGIRNKSIPKMFSCHRNTLLSNSFQILNTRTRPEKWSHIAAFISWHLPFKMNYSLGR